MRPPIVIISDDFDIFESVVDAERYVEPPDVRAGRIKIYDRDGRPIRASIEKRLLAEVVRFEDQEGAEPKPEELRLKIANFLTKVDGSTRDTYAMMSLEELLDRALKYKPQ
jgi:hypothetical protein